MRNYFFLSIAILIGLPCLSQNWNTGSGGNSARDCATEALGPRDEVLLWEGSLNAVVAQQAVIEGNIVAMSRMFDIGDVLQGTDIVAQDLSTGNFLWTATLPVEFPNTDWRNRVSAIRDGQVYATRAGNTNLSYMYALGASDGTLLWKSEDMVDESSTESTSFAENGDLIIGNNRSVLRVDLTDGSTVWKTDRHTPTSNGQEVSVFGSRGYFWQPSPFGPIISVIDIETGDIIHESPPWSAGIIQQLGLFVGPDGTVYAPRSMNNLTTDSLFALIDDGTQFFKKWATPIGYVPFSTSGVAPDGTIYTYSREGAVMRLDDATGDILNTSEIILTGASSSPRMAIDGDGYVYVTNGEFADGRFYVFNPDLSTRWFTDVRNVNIGGPAIGHDGTLVICGVGDDVRAYKGVSTSVADVPIHEIQIYPNPAIDHVNINQDDIRQGSDIRVIDLTGKVVFNEPIDIASRIIDISHLISGSYLLEIVMSGKVVAVGRFIKR